MTAIMQRRPPSEPRRRRGDTSRQRTIPAIALALLLAGCASDDPKQGGFFGGLIGLGSGAYEDRVDQESAALNAEQVRYQEGIDDQDRLDGAVKERRAQADRLEREIAALGADIGDLDAEIAAMRRDEAVTLDDVTAAEAKVAALVDEIDRVQKEQAAHEQAKALGADADRDTDPAQFGEPSADQVSDLRAYINKLQDALEALKAARDRRLEEGAGRSDEATN